MQTVSSMQTSINTSKIPAVWNKLNYKFLQHHMTEEGLFVVDYGCGRRATWEKVLLHLKCRPELSGVNYFPYDPYWVETDRNRNAISCLIQWGKADLCVCANVINVVDSVDAIKNIIKEVTQAKYWVFAVYEGNKSGNGEYTKGGTCFQHNKRAKEYCWIFNEVLEQSYHIKGNLITNCLDILA